MNRRELFATLAAAGLSSAFVTRAFAASDDPKTAARDLWLYGLPLIEMAATRAMHVKGGAAINRLRHSRTLADHQARTVTTPNNDTLYSMAWLDLTAGPVSLTVPPIPGRYWSVAIMNMYTDNDVVLGSRTVGEGGGRFTIVGPGQTGGGANIARISTPHAFLLIRTLTDGGDDLPATHAVQDGFVLSGPAAPPPPAYADRGAAPADYFATVKQLLASDPPPPTDTRILARLNGLDLASPEVAAGVAEARTIVAGARGRQTFVQGWTYTRPNLGDFGQDYLYRAIIAMSGLAALPVVEAMYMRSEGDGNGVFTGEGLYRLALPAQMPFDGFWSLSMYELTPEGQQFFTDNPIHRYAIGDRTGGLKRNLDSSLDLWIGRSDPGGERTANWLPAPKTGPFGLTLRLYLPRADLLDGRWRLPAIVAA